MENKVFSWKSWHPRADAQKIGEELESLGESPDPAGIVELASNPKTELHKCFEWDSKTAAQKYREYQARNIVNHLTVTYVTREGVTIEGVPAYVSVMRTQEDESSERGYVNIETALAVEEYRSSIYAQVYSQIHMLKATLLKYDAVVQSFGDAQLKLTEIETMMRLEAAEVA